MPWPLDINPQLHGSQCPQGSDSCLADFKGKVFTDFRIIIGCVDDHHLKLIVYFLLSSTILTLFNNTSYKGLSLPFS